MPHLGSKDLKRVLEGAAALNFGTGMETLPDRTLNCIRSLIPDSSMTAFDGFDTEGDYTGYYWYSPAGSVPEERVKLLGELIHEHPYYKDVLLTSEQNTFRTSDYVSLSKFHRSELFNEFYRLFEGEAQMTTAIRLSPKSLVTCSIHRPNKDFTDGEVEMLRLITPHLRAAFQNAREFEQINNRGRYLAAAVTRGIVVFDSKGEVAFINDIAERIFQLWFDRKPSGVIPGALNRYVLGERAKFGVEDYYCPTESVILQRDAAELTIRLCFDSETGELTLLLEEKRARTKEEFQKLGLTERECEILDMMSRGKTDREIALLCGISYRTVEKHAEHLYTKLGVETRLAAVMVAVDLLTRL